MPGLAPAAPRELSSVEVAETPRDATGLPELDGVLGGGLVPGSLILVGGDPGIGKSTLVLQVARALAASGRRVLYVAGEKRDRKSTRLNSSHLGISYAVFC